MSKSAARKRGMSRKRKRQEEEVEEEEEEEEKTMNYKALQARIRELEEENKRINALLSRTTPPPPLPSSSSSSSFKVPVQTVKIRKLTKNISCYPRRTVALLVTYLGCDPFMRGDKALAPPLRQALLKAMQTVQLIDKDSLVSFQGLGSGVGEARAQHPLEMVVGAVVRSRGNTAGPSTIALDNQSEIDYPALLNEALPSEIRVLAWRPVSSGSLSSSLSSSSSCSSSSCSSSSSAHKSLQIFKYFFPRGHLDLKAITTTAQHLVTEQERQQQSNTVTTLQQVTSITVTPCDPDTTPSEPHTAEGSETAPEGDHEGYEMLVMAVKGRGLAVADVRKVVGALLAVGGMKIGDDDVVMLRLPDVLSSQHLLASEYPLYPCPSSLCGAETWCWDKAALTQITTHLQEFWTQHTIRAAASRDFLRGYESAIASVSGAGEVPQGQCQGILAGQTVHPVCASITSPPTDHEYAAVEEEGRGREEMKGGLEEDQAPSLPSHTHLLLQLVHPWVRMLVGGSSKDRNTALRGLQSQIAQHGVTCSMAMLGRLWDNLLADHTRAQQLRQAGHEVIWQHYEAVDSLLSGLDIATSPPSEVTPTVTSDPSVSPKVTVEVESSGSTSNEPQLVVHVIESVEPSSGEPPVATSYTELPGETTSPETSQIDDREVESEIETGTSVTDKTETCPSISVSLSPATSPISMLMQKEDWEMEEEEEDDDEKEYKPRRKKKIPSKTSRAKNRPRSSREKRSADDKEMRKGQIRRGRGREEEEKEEMKGEPQNRRQKSSSSSSNIFIHHQNDNIFATETNPKPGTDATAIFLKYFLHQGQTRQRNLEEAIMHFSEKEAQRDDYRRRKEEVQVENVLALSEIESAMVELKAGLMEV